MCDRGGGSGSGSPEDENPVNRRNDTPPSSEDEGRPGMVSDANARDAYRSNSERNYVGLGEPQRNFPEHNRSNDTDEELEDCNCNVGRLRQAVSSNFQLEREIRFAWEALEGLRVSCEEQNAPADHPSIENLQSALDAVVSPESCWNSHGTTYHERALARFREPQEFAAQQERLSEAINQVQPLFGPEANSLIRWDEDDVLSLVHIPPRVRAHERGVRDAIGRELAEPFLNASARNQEETEAAGYGRCPQNMAALGVVQQRVGSMADDDPLLPRYLPVLSDMQGLQRQRSAILDEQEAAVCSNCLRQLDPEYPGYTPAEERELNRELLADPRRCARNNEMIPSLVLPHLDQPPQGRNQGRCADLNQTMAVPPVTLSDQELVFRQEADDTWVNHEPRRPNWRSYTIGSETFRTHPPECRCATDPDCNCPGCNTDRRDSAIAEANGAANAQEAEAAAAAAAAAAEEAAAAQEAAAAAEAARVAAEEASNQRLLAIRAKNRAERPAAPAPAAPFASSTDFSTVPTTRPDTPRRPRTRAAQRALAAQSQCGAGAAPAAEPEAGMQEALLAEQAAAAAAAQAATEARLKCLKAKRLADKVARPPPERRSERIKRKRVADTGVEEPGCPPGCACANCVADRDNQQGPSKRPPRGGGGGCGGGGAGGCGGQGVSA